MITIECIEYLFMFTVVITTLQTT